MDSDDSEELQPWKKSPIPLEREKSVENEPNSASNREKHLEERERSFTQMVLQNNAQLIGMNKKFGSQRSLMTSRFQGLPTARKDNSLAALLQRANSNKSGLADPIALPNL